MRAALMCSQCDNIDAQIKRLRDIASRMLDQQTLDGGAVGIIPSSD
jgi:hypothetical protein